MNMKADTLMGFNGLYSLQIKFLNKIQPTYKEYYGQFGLIKFTLD